MSKRHCVAIFDGWRAPRMWTPPESGLPREILDAGLDNHNNARVGFSVIILASRLKNCALPSAIR